VSEPVFDYREWVCLVQRSDDPRLFGIHVPAFAVIPLPLGYDGQTRTRMHYTHQFIIAERAGLPSLRCDWRTGRTEPMEGVH
jgi:hypothetical protein